MGWNGWSEVGGDAPSSGWVAAVYGNRLISIVTDGVLNESH